MAKIVKKSIPMTDGTAAQGRVVMSAEQAREAFNLKPRKETLDKIRERQEASMLTEERLGRSRIG